MELEDKIIEEYSGIEPVYEDDALVIKYIKRNYKKINKIAIGVNLGLLTGSVVSCIDLLYGKENLLYDISPVGIGTILGGVVGYLDYRLRK